ncbi:acyl-CoA-like ligand-binding transcription factor [Hamadaea tsunoensis]|uniref:acyl-CoA-like ligand-binding transcription factor n=1 Tax=Hamadaea tsunoensis TaxID=53368 RepID=UPI000413BF86|nr:TetR family transcriptional regulator [Hamadaea tsunoensis]
MSTPGLRERKKARTRQAIQEAAYRLIKENGYEATTVDQIAAAAEVSPATFFRYFPTKEDTIIRDEYDPIMVESWRKHMRDGRSPIATARLVVAETLGHISPADQELFRWRTRLMYSVPALRARVWDNFSQTQTVFAELIGEQLGLPANDIRVLATTGGFIGALISVFEYWSDRPELSVAEVIDTTLSVLEQGI